MARTGAPASQRRGGADNDRHAPRRSNALAGKIKPGECATTAGEIAVKDIQHINLAAEVAVLGGILEANANYHRIADIVTDEDFYNPAHAAAFSALALSIRAGQTTDAITMDGRIERPLLLQMVESAAYGPELTDYARVISDLATRRRMVDAAEALEAASDDTQSDLDGLLERSHRGVLDIIERRAGKIEWESAPIAVADELEKLAEQVRSGKSAGMSTGLGKLDQAIGGLHRGDLLCVAGASSMGKTALAVNIAVGAARTEGRQVALFSQEMTREQLAWRLASSEARRQGHGTVAYQEMRNGNLGMNEVARLRAGLKTLPKTLNWNCARGLTITDISTAARRLHRKSGLDVIVVDYLQILNHDDGSRDTRATRIGKTTMGLKVLAGELNCAVVMLSQLSRLKGRDDKRPQLDDLRESGSIEQDSDSVIFVYREEYYLERLEPKPKAGVSARNDPDWLDWYRDLSNAEGKLDAIIAKQRMGPITTVELFFEPQTDLILDDKKLLEDEEAMV